jgi:acetyl esterase
MSFNLLTPQMAGVLDRVRRAKAAPFYEMGVAEARRAYVERSEVLELPREPLPRVENLNVPGSAGEPLPARLYAPRARDDHAALPLVLYLHGGGFVIGGLDTHDSLCRQLARRADVAVLAIEYRLAPEHRFPSAVDDCWAVLRWIFAEGAVLLGTDPGRLAVAGDSAGGTLSAVCAVLARDARLPLALQVLITPGTAVKADSPSHRLFAQGFLLEAQGIAWFFDHYIDPADRHDWRFAPLEAPDLEAVAPALVVLAECDPLVDEGLAYADRLRTAGVPTELELFRGLTHDFIKMGRAIPEAVTAQQRIAEALRRAFGST